MWDRTESGLVAILVAFCVVGAIHSVAVPLFEAPDEIWHFSFVQLLATERTLPVQPAEGKDMWLRETAQPPLYYLVAALAIAPLDTSDFPGFVRFNVAHPAVTPQSESEAPNVFIHTWHESFPYRGAVLAIHVVRLITVLWGAGTVVGVYLVTREVLPTRPRMALVAAAVTAFNPHFAYISSVVNNDAAVACLCTLALWLAIRLGRGQAARKMEVVLGCVLGLALLSKLSALALLLLIPLAMGVTWWRDRDARALVVRLLIVSGLAFLVAGWWYVRNWLLYGDPLAWSVWLIDIGRQRIGLIELLRQFRDVTVSFWSPYQGLFPTWVLWVLDLFLAVAAVGWVKLIVLRRVGRTGNAEGLLLAGLWFVLVFASLVRYMTITPAAAGRLLFPAIGPFSVLLALGLDTSVPGRWSAAASGVVAAGLFLLSVASPLCGIAPRYALPLIDSPEELSGTVSLGDGVLGTVRLLGVRVDPDEARTGETVAVTLYWEALGMPPPDLRAVVRLWTIGGRFVGQRDTMPAGEVYPPDLWRKGDVVRDVRYLQVEGDGPATCRVVVSVLAGDEEIGEVASPAVLRLEGSPVASEEIAHPLRYSLGGKIELIGYDAWAGPVASGGYLSVTLYWRGLGEMSEDYTVFVHLVGPDGTLLGQGDGPPLGGDYPTSGWIPGQLLADTHTVPLTADGLADAHLLVGLYRLADGARLEVFAATGERVPDDVIRLELDDVVVGP